MPIDVGGTEMTVPPDWTADGAGTIHANNYTDNDTQLSNAAVRALFSGAGATSYNNSTGVITSTDTDTNTTYNWTNFLVSGTKIYPREGHYDVSGNSTRYVTVTCGRNVQQTYCGSIYVGMMYWGSNPQLVGGGKLFHFTAQMRSGVTTTQLSASNPCSSGPGISWGGLSAGTSKFTFSVTNNKGNGCRMAIWMPIVAPNDSVAGHGCSPTDLTLSTT